jgi:hypothetical protein
VEQDLQLTPQEERLLRRFFRRHALPYIAGSAAAVVFCLAFAFLPGDGQTPPAPLPEPGADAAAIGELRADLDRALADLATERTRAREQAGDATRSASALEQRLAAVFQRIEQVESRADATQHRVDEVLAQGSPPALPAAPDGAATSAAAAAPDQLLHILQRLYDLEKLATARAGNAPQPPADADPR